MDRSIYKFLNPCNLIIHVIPIRCFFFFLLLLLLLRGEYSYGVTNAAKNGPI